MNTTKTKSYLSSRWARMLLLFVLFLSFQPANALTFEYGQFTYVTNSDTTVRLAFRGVSNQYHVTGHLEIPSVVYHDGVGYQVSEIDDIALCNNAITSLVVPGTVKRIGRNAFINCPITELTLEEGVQLIDGGAFASCVKLDTLTLPSSITTINAGFMGCKGLKTVYIKGATDIGSLSFYYCTDLEHVTLGKDVRKITYNAFANCPKITDVIIEDGDTQLACDSESFGNSPISNLYIGRDITCALPSIYRNTLEHVTLGPKMTFIVSGMFEGWTKLTSLVIPSRVKTIHNAAFKDCTGLKELVIGDGVETIGRSAFSGCTALSSLTMGKNIITINEWAFYNCSSLRSSDLQFGDSLKFIYAYAFTNCTGLTEFTIPKSVERVGARVFKGCSHLKKVVIEDSSKALCMESDASISETTEFEGCPLKEIHQGRDQYLYWESGPDVIPYYWTMADCPFSRFSSIKKVTIGNHVKMIPDYYYFGTGIATVVIPNSVKEIRHQAFSCPNLKAVVLGKGVNIIGDYALSSPTMVAVYCPKMAPPTLGRTVFSTTTTNEGILYVPTGSKAAYQSADGWKEFKNIVEISDAEFNEVINHLEEMYGYVAGDANGDREVNISDINTIVDAILGSKQDINYDMNDDFEVNIADINAIINYILGSQ